MDCRAVGSKGDVVVSDSDAGAGRPLLTDAEIPSDVWLSLSRGARVVAKDPRTTRETIFTGPARVRACANHREDSWVASGVFESTPGAGETPGAEEWVVTPFAVVRYASAKVRVIVRPGGATVMLAGGVAFVRPQDDTRGSVTPEPAVPDAGPLGKAAASQEPWLRVSEGTVELRPLRQLPPSEAVRSAIDECATLSDRAQALAQRVLNHEIGDGGNASLGQAIVEQVTTHRLARAACAVATLRTQVLPPSDERAAWAAAIARSEMRWSTYSSPPAAR
jgi:hypothetical protein